MNRLFNAKFANIMLHMSANKQNLIAPFVLSSFAQIVARIIQEMIAICLWNK